MKIVHICLCGPVTDGWSYQDNMLTKYHKKMGHDVTMITSEWIWETNGKLKKYEHTNYINSDGVKVVRIPLKGEDKFSRKFKRYKGLNEILLREKADILFIHNIAFLDINIIVDYLKENKGVKVFIDNHSDYSNSATSWVSKNILHKVIWRYIVKKIEPYTLKFYGVLPARVDFLIDLYNIPKDKVELLVMGADDEKVKENNSVIINNYIRSKHGIDENDFLIVTGGKIDESKMQVLLLMKAIKKINRKNVKLIVFGPVIESLKSRVEELSDGINIQYIGWIDSDESYKYFASADLVVFPGRHSVFWEQAVAQGRPIICKYWDGTTHVDLGGNAMFIKYDDTEEIYKILMRIINDKDTYNKMLYIAQKVSNKFLYSNIAKASIKGVKS